MATLNLRNIADRWGERIPLLLADFAALQPDLIGLQECVFAVQQDRVLGAAGAAAYTSHRGWAGRPEYGNAVLVRDGFATATAEPERLDLGHNRSALWVPLRLEDGATIAYVVTHLHHLVPDEELRDQQASMLLAWLDAHPDPRTQVVVGDFNAEPTEPTYRRMVDAGFRSAHLEANGQEPSVTWPSGIQAEGMDTDGDPGCLDYIWIRGDVRATSCTVTFARPAVDDPTLFPSDHFGLAAHLTLGA